MHFSALISGVTANVLNRTCIALKGLSSDHLKCQHPSESKAYKYALKPFPAIQLSPHHQQRPGKFEIIRSTKGSRDSALKLRTVSEGNRRLKQYLPWSVFPFPDVQ